MLTVTCPGLEPQSFGELVVIDLRDVLDLPEVVAGAERPELRASPFDGTRG